MTRSPEPCTGRHEQEAPPMVYPKPGWIPQVGGFRIPAAVYECACGTVRTVPTGPPERVSASAAPAPS